MITPIEHYLDAALPSCRRITLALGASGVITATVATPTSFYGAITRDKNLMVCVWENRNDPTVGFRVFVRTGGTNFSQADMQGEWRANWLTLEPAGQSDQDSWWRSLAVIDSNYVRNFDKVINGVVQPNRISPLTISVLDSGVVQGFAGNGEGIMSLDKKLVVITQSDGTNLDYSMLQIVLK